MVEGRGKGCLMIKKFYTNFKKMGLLVLEVLRPLICMPFGYEVGWA